MEPTLLGRDKKNEKRVYGRRRLYCTTHTHGQAPRYEIRPASFSRPSRPISRADPAGLLSESSAHIGEGQDPARPQPKQKEMSLDQCQKLPVPPSPTQHRLTMRPHMTFRTSRRIDSTHRTNWDTKECHTARCTHKKRSNNA